MRRTIPDHSDPFSPLGANRERIGSEYFGLPVQALPIEVPEPVAGYSPVAPGRRPEKPGVGRTTETGDDGPVKPDRPRGTFRAVLPAIVLAVGATVFAAAVVIALRGYGPAMTDETQAQPAPESEGEAERTEPFEVSADRPDPNRIEPAEAGQTESAPEPEPEPVVEPAAEPEGDAAPES